MFKRPLSVWFFQIVTALFALVLLLVVSRIIITTPLKVISLLWLVERLAVLAVFIFVQWSLIRPRPWARWTGFFTILLFAVALIMIPLEPQTNLPHFTLENDAQRGGALIGRFFTVLLITFWAYRFAYGKKSKLFFGRA